MSSLKDLASLIMIPSLVKDGRLDTVKPLGNSIIHPDATGNNDGTDGSTPAEGNFTFSRGSNLAATRVDVNGLIEKGRENLLLYSNDITNAAWLKASMNITSGQTSYNGSSTAFKLIPNTTSTFHRIIQSQSWAGDVRTASFYAKADGYNIVRIVTFTGATDISLAVDLSDGSIVQESGSTKIATNVQSVGNEWYRISLTASGSNTTSIYAIQIYVYDDPALPSAWSGDGTSGVLFADPQRELGLVATDYIETGASTAQSGILEDLPRLDYSGGASCPSLLLEPSRANLLPYSEYLGNSSWSLAGFATRSLENVITPDGGNLVYKIQANNNSQGRLQTYITANGNNHIFSGFFKGTGVATRIRTGNNQGTSVYYDIDANGNFTFVTGNAINDNYGIEDYSNGWKRIYWETNTAAGVSNYFQIYADNTGGTGSVYAYGIMIEQGSYSTSYIPTMGSAVTRSKDSCVSSSLTTSTDFTIFFEAPNFCLINGGVSTSYNNIQFVFSDNGNAYSPNGSYHIYSNSLFYYDGANASGYGVIFNNQTDSKFVIMKRGDKVLVFANGAKKTEANLPSGVDASIWDTINLTESLEDGDKDVFGSNYKQLLKFDTALTDSECIALTTI